MNEIVIRPASWCEYEYRACPGDCPLDAAEARLREAHRRWHECIDSYHDPDDFRDALNSAIQAMRNVTFVLQAAKSQIPDFDSWYALEQDKMRADRILRWIVNSRNTVVKQGDLKTHSRLKIALVSGYEEEADLVACEQRAWDEFLRSNYASITKSAADAPVELSLEEAMVELSKIELPMMARQKATVLFERRWVADDMPDLELLTVLAHAYGRLRELVMKCHELLGLAPTFVAFSSDSQGQLVARDFEEVDKFPLGGRLPCMASSRSHRTTRLRLVDNSVVHQFITQRIEYDPAISEMLTSEKPYGDPVTFPANAIGELQTTAQLHALVEYTGAMAARVLESGQDHGWFTYYFRKGKLIGNRTHATIDAQGKQAIAIEISKVALELYADAVIMIGETWFSPQKATWDGGYVPPEYHPDRGEGLLVNAIARSGAVAGMLLPFRVLEGEPPHRRVQLLEPTKMDSVTGVLIPTRQAWGCDTPPLTGIAFWRAQGQAKA